MRINSKKLKYFPYFLAKWVGLFSISRQLTKKKLRILAYHGSSMSDEADFRPQLFISPKKFQSRVDYLISKKYPILNLEDAIRRLKKDQLPDFATVITFDDGFYSTFKLAVPILLEHNVPFTIYVTTYYAIKENPIFRLVVQYLFWKTNKEIINLNGLGLQNERTVELSDDFQKNLLVEEIIAFSEKSMEEEERLLLCEQLGQRLEVDYGKICEERFLSLMTLSEISSIAQQGVDIQLHTHRHVLPLSLDGIKQEIHANRKYLEPAVGKELKHFCYPSGIYEEVHFDYLEKVDVSTATTCRAGFNDSKTPLLCLNRFLDGDNIFTIEFEAELTGFSELLRKIRKWCLKR